MKRKIYLFLCVSTAVMCVGCMEKEDKPPYFLHVESVEIDTTRVLEIRLNKSVRLPYTVFPLEAGNQGVTWYSRDETVATVSSGGLVTALKLDGRTKIGVQTNDMRLTDEIDIIVTRFVADIPMTSFDTEASNHLFDVKGGDVTPLVITPSYLPADASDPYFRLTSSDPWVVDVVPNDPEKPTSYTLVPVGYGKVTITAEAIDGSDLPAQTMTMAVNGTRDRNYTIEGGINADGYYEIVYEAINYKVGEDGQGNPVYQTWLDRNLGAKQVATVVNDPASYGSKFQWSRKADGHEQTQYTDNAGSITWSLVFGRADANAKAPNRANAGGNQFIPVTVALYDWVVGEAGDSGLWGGTMSSYTATAPLEAENQANNPCPAGYRLPTGNECLALINAATNAALVASSNKSCPTAPSDLFEAIKLPSCGEVTRDTGAFNTDGRALYWNNVPASSGNGVRWGYVAGNIHSSNYSRCSGYAIRCIKDTPLESTDINL